MADSNYPASIDTDVTLPRIDDNITEIGGDAINGLRSAVFNIEETLGINLQGTASDLATRINVSLNQDGSIKASALSSIGLVTLPIINTYIATNAGIEESKLDLDHGTSELYTLINNINLSLLSLSNNVAQDVSNLSRHVIHQSSYGRHQTRDIDGYVGKFTNYNLQGIITEIDTVLLNHINNATSAHNASAILFDDSRLSILADNVQVAIEQLDVLQETLMIQHRTLQHGNGLIENQDVNIFGTNNSELLVSASVIGLFPTTRSQVTFSPVPAGLSNVTKNDIIIITIGSTVSSYYINTVNISSGVVTFFGTSTVSGTGTAEVYSNKAEQTTVSPLIIAIKQNYAGSGNNTIQLVHPGAPFILSNGLDARKVISSSTDLIKINWGVSATTGDLDIYTALNTISSDPSNWVPTIVSQAFNDLFVANYLPLISFVYNDQVGISFNEVLDDYYIEIGTPSSRSAWSSLGFVEGDISYAKVYNKFYIDGYEFRSIHKKIDTTAQATGTGIDTFPSGTNLFSAGLQNGDILRIISGVAGDTGTYTVNSFATDSLFVNLKNFTSNSVSLKCYDDSFSVTSPVSIEANFYEIFVDGYENNFEARLNVAVRAHSARASSSPANYVKFFDIIDVSRDFKKADRRILYNQTNKTLQMGQRGTGITLVSGTEGVVVNLPTNASTAIGHRFRLYDNNGVDYIDFEIADSSYVYSSFNQAVDITIYDRISEKYFLQIGVVLHNGDGFKQLSDRRWFGNVGRKDIRDDFIRDYITYPTSVLRSGGIIYGFEVSSASSPERISVSGGQLLVDGTTCYINTTVFAIPISGSIKTYNLYAGSGGTLNLVEDNSQGIYPTPSLSDIIASTDKTIIAQIFVNASNIITNIIDLRRFVGNIDSKMELIVGDNDKIQNSFDSLQAACDWIRACDSAGLPTSRTIKIRGEIELDISSSGFVTLPSGVTIEGDANYFTSFTSRPKIKVVGTGTRVFELSGPTYIKNLMIEIDSTGYVDTAVFYPGFSGSVLWDFHLENCYILNLKATAPNAACVLYTSGNTAYYNSITNCRIYFNNGTNNTYVMYGSTISSLTFCHNKIYSFSTSSGGFIYGSGMCANTIVNENEWTYDARNVNTKILNISQISGIIFNNNICTNVGTIANLNSVVSANINNNYCINCLALVYSGSSFSSANISGNIFLTDLINTNGIINLNSCQKINIVDNQFYCSDVATTTSTQAMIKAVTYASSVCISQNVIYNAGTPGKGYLIAIYLYSSIGSIISNNIIYGFNSTTSSYGSIYLSAAQRTNIIGNNITYCYISLYLAGLYYGLISGNYFHSHVSTGLITMTSVSTSVNITGNTLIFTGDTTNSYMLYLNSVSGKNISILNNYFKFENTVNPTYSYIYMSGTNANANHTVMNNVFRPGTATDFGSNFAITVATAVTKVIVSNNDLRGNTSTNGNIIYNPSGTDNGNYGQSYSFTMTASMAQNDISQDGADRGSSMWKYVNDHWQCWNAWYAGGAYANDDLLCYTINSTDIPQGATIYQVAIAYAFIGGAGTTTDLHWRLTRSDNIAGMYSGSTTVRAAADVSSASGSIDVDYYACSITMEANRTIEVAFEPQYVSATYNIWVFGPRFYYTL